MSSFRFEGEGNRGAGRDYYENCEWNLHLYAGSLGNAPKDAGPPRKAPTLEQLSFLRREAKKQCRRAQLRIVFNFPYLAMVALLMLAVISVLATLSDLSSFLQGPPDWRMLVPFVLVGAIFIVQMLGAQHLKVVKQQAREAEAYLHEINMHIARRQEADRLSRTNRKIK